jgi:ketosteroid isomerase-like protein
MRKIAPAAGMALGLLAALPAAGQDAPPTGGRVPTVTRLVKIMTELETHWMDAVRRKDQAALEGILDQDYELRTSARPGDPVPRAAWLASAMGDYNLRSFQVSQMAVRSLGDLAIVSFSCSQGATVAGKDRSGDFFLVDVWRQKADEWKVLARYAGPVEGRPSPGVR